MDKLEQIAEEIRRFRDERDWMQFHDPKNLAISISLEANELLEHFQWCTPEQSFQIGIQKKEAVASEIADVAIYLIEMADNLNIDLVDSILKKLSHNNEKYPVAKARGNALKYTEFEQPKDPSA